MSGLQQSNHGNNRGRNMGGDLCQLEPNCDPSWKDNVELWNYLQMGGVSNYIEKIKGHDHNVENLDRISTLRCGYHRAAIYFHQLTKLQSPQTIKRKQ